MSPLPKLSPVFDPSGVMTTAIPQDKKVPALPKVAPPVQPPAPPPQPSIRPDVQQALDEADAEIAQTQQVAAPPFIDRGNINLFNRPSVPLPDGKTASVLSKSFNFDGQEVLLPTISDDGRVMTDQETQEQYLKTGKYLGKFKTVNEANAYAEQLHLQQESLSKPQGIRPDIQQALDAADREMGIEPITPAAPVRPPIPQPEQPPIPTLKAPTFAGDVARGAMSMAATVTDKAMGMIQGAGQLPGEVFKSIKNANLNALWQFFPEQMKAFGDSREIQPVLEQDRKQQLEGQFSMVRDAVQDIHGEIMEDIRKQPGGLAASVAQTISESIMDLAITLTTAKLTGGGKLPIRSVKDVPSELKGTMQSAARFGGLIATITPGNLQERTKAGMGATAFIMAPVTVAGINSAWLRGAILVGEYTGMSVTAGAYGQAIEQAKQLSQQDGRPDDWRLYLPQTMTPIAVQDLIFGIMGAARGGDKTSKTVIDSAPKVKKAIADMKAKGASPEFRSFFGGIDPKITGTTPEKVAAFAKTLGMEWQPTAVAIDLAGKKPAPVALLPKTAAELALKPPEGPRLTEMPPRMPVERPKPSIPTEGLPAPAPAPIEAGRVIPPTVTGVETPVEGQKPVYPLQRAPEGSTYPFVDAQGRPVDANHNILPPPAQPPKTILTDQVKRPIITGAEAGALPSRVEPTPKPVAPEVITDPTEVQEIRNSIAEGRLMLRSGKFNDRKLSTEELLNVRRQVERDLEKIGESRLAGKIVGAEITDVTPEGYGPGRPAEPEGKAEEVRTLTLKEQRREFQQATTEMKARKKAALDEIEDSIPAVQSVLEDGGITPSKTMVGTGIIQTGPRKGYRKLRPAEQEEYQGIDEIFQHKKGEKGGQSLDEAASKLNMTGEELKRKLSDAALEYKRIYEGKREGPTGGELEAEAKFKAEEDARWDAVEKRLRKTGEELSSGRVGINDEFTREGEVYRVVAEGDTGLIVEDGKQLFIPYETPGAKPERFYIDKGSLVKAEPKAIAAKGELFPAEDLALVGKEVPDTERIMRERAADVERIATLERQAQELPGIVEPVVPESLADVKRPELLERAKALDIDTTGKPNPVLRAEITAEQAKAAESPEKLINEMPIPEGMKRDVGLRNIAGTIGFTKPTKVEPDSPNVVAVDMQQTFDKQRQDVSDKLNLTWSKIKDEYLKKITASDAPIMRRIAALPGGEKVVIDKVLSTGWAEKQSEDYGIVKKYIKEHLPYRLNNSFDDYLQARRTVEVSKLMRENRGIQPELFVEGELPEIIKSPEGKGSIPNQAWIDEFKRTHPKDFQALEFAGKRWDETMKTIRDEYLQEGLIDQETYDYLAKYHKAYSPRKFIQHIDPTTEVNQGGKVMSISSSGLKALDTGSEKSLVNNSNYLLARVLATKEARIFKNRANRSLYDFISENKDNPLGLRIETPVEEGRTPASDMTRISVMIDGEQKTMVGPTELMQTWIQTDPQMKRQTAAIIQWVMGGKIVKPLATGYSPFFALRNPFRDFSHYWFVTDEWSPHKPAAWVQQNQDIKDVWNDVMHEGPLVKLYFKTGGGTSFLSSQGRLGRDLTGTSEIANDAVDQVESALAWLPRRSELLGRVALMNRAIKNRAKKNNLTYEQALQNKDIVKESVYIAKSALDFAQGGTLVKTFDNYKPYLNAAVQAGRTSANAFRARPWQTTFKAAQVMAFGAAQYLALYYLANKAYEKGVEGQWDKYTGIDDFKKCWDSISDADDAGNWTFPTPFYKKDKNGRKRYFYFRIPVEQTQQAFKVIGEQAARIFMTGEKPNYRKLAQALSNFSPIDIQTLLPPTLAAVMGYASNKDFWMQQDIWKGRRVPPSLEYDADTPTGWRLAGKVGLSPKRMQKAVSQVIPQNDYLSIFTGVTSAMQLAEDDTLNQKTWTILTRTPGLRAFFRVTQPTDLTDADIQKARQYNIPTEYPDGEPMPRQVIWRKVNEKELDANTEKQLNDFHQDVLVGQIRRKEIDRDEMSEWIGTTQGKEMRRLSDRLAEKYHFYRDIYDQVGPMKKPEVK